MAERNQQGDFELLNDHNNENSGLHSALKDIKSSSANILASIGVFARHAWNWQMGMLVKVGLMPMFRTRWWLFCVIAFVLLAVKFAVGVVWVAIAAAALIKSPKAENDYIVDISRHPS